MRGEKYLLKGQIKVESSSADDAFELPNNIIVDILNSAGSVVDGTTANLSSSGSDQTTTGLYEYSVWANLGEKLIFGPRDSR